MLGSADMFGQSSRQFSGNVPSSEHPAQYRFGMLIYITSCWPVLIYSSQSEDTMQEKMLMLIKSRALIAAGEELKDACIKAVSADPSRILTERVRKVFVGELKNLLHALAALSPLDRRVVGMAFNEVVKGWEDFVSGIEKSLDKKDKGREKEEDGLYDELTRFWSQEMGNPRDLIASISIGTMTGIANQLMFSIRHLNPKSDGKECWLEISTPKKESTYKNEKIELMVDSRNLRLLARLCLKAANELEGRSE